MSEQPDDEAQQLTDGEAGHPVSVPDHVRTDAEMTVDEAIGSGENPS
jgi:hypothetical protein